MADLTGEWHGNDGGIYHIRHLPDHQIWWHGTNPAAGWDNVFHGYLRGDTVTGEWSDTPGGKVAGHGNIQFHVKGGGRELERTGATGGFGGSHWTRK